MLLFLMKVRLSSYLLKACRDDLATLYAFLSGSRSEEGLPAAFHFLKALTRAASAFLILGEVLGGEILPLGILLVDLGCDASFEQLTRSFEKSSVRNGTTSGVSQ